MDDLLNKFVDNVHAVEHAVVLSADGLLKASAYTLSRDDAERLAALASSTQRLVFSASHLAGYGGVRMNVAELERGYWFTTAAGEGTSLAVFATEDADINTVGYEMRLLVKRLGERLSTAPRERR